LRGAGQYISTSDLAATLKLVPPGQIEITCLPIEMKPVMMQAMTGGQLSVAVM
jgi:hypothetical protein